MKEVLQATAHRPWPLPRGPWIMAQSWHDLLFAHWRVPPRVLRDSIPEALEIDTWDGETFLGVVPFRMSNIRPRGLFPVPGLSAFPELNVRTYVAAQDRGIRKPGVFFYSLDAANPVAVMTARIWFLLPYFNATMSCLRAGERLRYRSERTHRGAKPAEFVATYGPEEAVRLAEPGSLEHWLTERYCLYTANSRGELFIGEIHHVAWPLQRASASIEQNTMAHAAGVILPNDEPLLHFARSIDVAIWGLRRVEP